MELTVGTDYRGQRLDHFLQSTLAEFSRSRLQSWVKDGRVLVDGKPGKSAQTLRGGERVLVEPAALPPLHASPEDLPLTILYQDDDVIAVDKPAGMTVHMGAGVHTGTLVNALLHHFGQLSKAGGDERPGIVHRIDRGTSGVLLVARNDAAHRHLAAQFAKRQIEKTYLALVHGTMSKPRGVIETAIARDPVHRTKMTARLGRGRAAYTEYEVLATCGRFSYLQVRIGTGRTHQIRVHLASIGHVVAGDRVYGAPAATPGMPDPPRFFLHAHEIKFTQPRTGQPITVNSPLAPELVRWRQELGC